MASVLIVDDDVDIGETMADLLRDAGHEVAYARNGLEAMQVLRGAEIPCLMLLDLMMPIMSGWEVLTALKADPSLSPIPVIVASAQPDERARKAALAVLRKPFSLEQLLELVERYCGVPGGYRQ